MQKKVDPFYKSRRWQKLREIVLRRDGYQCQIARRYGRQVKAEVVHHIFPRKDYPEYQYCSWNLISLSSEAHNKLHDRMTDTLTEEGMQLLKRTARKRGIEI